jgi:hypothetical protein
MNAMVSMPGRPEISHAEMANALRFLTIEIGSSGNADGNG